MTRNRVIYILIAAFIVGIAVWLFFSNFKDSEVVRQTPPRREVTSLARPTDNTNLREQMQVELQLLRQQVSEGQERLSSQRQALQELQQKEQEELVAPTTISSQITAYVNEIQEFLEELRGTQSAEELINRRASEVLRDQSSTAQVARDRVEDSLRQQEALLRRTQEEQNFWEQSGGMGTLSEREARTAELKTRLDEQTQQLQALRDQRLEISAQILNQTRAIQDEKNRALENLANNRDDLQGEITDLRQEIRRLQTEQYQSRTSQQSLRSQISQMQKNLQDQESELQSLQETLNNKEESLRTLY